MQSITVPDDRTIHGSLPLYGDLKPLTPERHGTVALAPEVSFEFAGGATTVPITIGEFGQAALDYPIAFFGPTRRALAVTGLVPGHNLFVNDRAAWRENAYVPAYVRRHPFALARHGQDDRWIVCIDESSDRLIEHDSQEGQALFENGAPSPRMREAVSFCEAYLAAEQRTERFVELLDELDLFEPRQAHRHANPAESDTQQPVMLLGYVAVSRDKLDTLDDASLLRLRAAGALSAIYAHLLSGTNWQRLDVRPG